MSLVEKGACDSAVKVPVDSDKITLGGEGL